MASRRSGMARSAISPEAVEVDMSIFGGADAEAMAAIDRKRRETTPQYIPLDRIIEDDEIQVRVDGLNPDVVAQYAVIASEGGDMDEVTLFQDGEFYYVADGFHRVAAWREAGRETIKAFVREGNEQAAMEFAELANLDHGYQLSSKDKKNILFRWLSRGSELAQVSNRMLAAQMGVDHKTIGNWITEYNSTGEFSPVDRSQTIGADGKIRDTSGISEANQERVSTPVINTPARPAPAPIRPWAAADPGDHVIEPKKLPAAQFRMGQDVQILATGDVLPIQSTEWTGSEYKYLVGSQPYLEHELGMKPPMWDRMQEAAAARSISPASIALYNRLNLAALKSSMYLREIARIEGLRGLLEMGPERLEAVDHLLAELDSDLAIAEEYRDWVAMQREKIQYMARTGQVYDAEMGE